MIMKKHRALVLLFKAHKFCRGRARKQAWDHARAEHRRRPKQSRHARDPARAKHVRRAKVQHPARPEHGCHATARAKASEANPAQGERGCHAKVSLAEAIQLAHARFSCASFGRVSQDSSHYACQRASPTVLAVSCKGSPAVLIIDFGFQTPKSLTTPPLKPCFLRLERAPVATKHDIIKKLALSECCTIRIQMQMHYRSGTVGPSSPELKLG